MSRNCKETERRDNCQCEERGCKGCYYNQQATITELQVKNDLIGEIILKIDKASDKFDNMPGDDVYRIIRAYIVDESNKFYYKLQKGANK